MVDKEALERLSYGVPDFESTDNIAMVYETLKNIDTAITRLESRYGC